MKRLRKILIDNFVLSYSFKIFGKEFFYPRASRIIYPLMALSGYIHSVNESPLSWSLIGVTLIAIYFGFIHFAYIAPVKWDELDDEQKILYGQIKSDKLTPQQFIEWLYLIKMKQDGNK